MSFTFTDKPATPTLTADNSDLTHGDDITLTCTTSTAGITNYEYLRNGQNVATTRLSTYKIANAAVGTHDGRYSCRAIVNTISSDPSNEIIVSGKALFVRLYGIEIYNDTT